MMVPLVVRSHYSLMRGTDSPEAVCRAARTLGYRQLALTDRNNLYGLWPFLTACKKNGIRPIVGAEITDAVAGRRAVCLVEDQRGYRNLCRIITARHCDPAFSLKTAFDERQHGLVVLTDDGELLENYRHKEIAVSALLAARPTQHNRLLRQRAQALGCRVVAVPDSSCSASVDMPIYRLLRAIAHNVPCSRLPQEEQRQAEILVDPAIYCRRFEIWPEAIRASLSLADRCVFSGPKFGATLPEYWEKDRAPAASLKFHAFEGARHRYGVPLPGDVVKRLEYELSLIDQKGFSSYFLIVRDIVRLASRSCGRGSGAASLVAYCLGITDVCPMRFNLYFERFLNPGRTDPPDIDIDFSWDERDRVLAAILAKYGSSAALVANHIFFRSRLALRQTAKVYGLSGRQTEQLLGAMQAARCQGKELAVPPGNTILRHVLEHSRRLQGIPRTISVHPGGVVVTGRSVSAYAPVQIAAKGVPIIQWEKDAAEAFGLIKIDVLGNRSLGVVRDALHAVRQKGAMIDETHWQPENDKRTQELIAKGKTMGCFYIESPAMRQLQKKAGRGDFKHLVLHSSIIRPAANFYIQEYLRRLHGGCWSVLHPLVEELLAESYGIMAYQEDAARIAVSLAGFSHTDADRLRKVLSKKDVSTKLADFRRRFMAGCTARQVAVTAAEEIWRMMLSFSGYSFCKPHSASYAKVSFQAAYLKAHYPAQFMAAVINNGGGFYSTFAYVSEARRLGLKIAPPAINEAAVDWVGKGRSLVIGLSALRHLQRATLDCICSARQHGAFVSIADFVSRVPLSEREGRMLVAAGAFDAVSGTNRTLQLWEFLSSRCQRATGELGLFYDAPQRPDFPAPAPYAEQRLEFTALGFLQKHHPVVLIRGQQNTPPVRARQLPERVGQRVELVGWLLTGKLVRTKKDEPMEFITFEDETGLFEATFFPRVFQRYGSLLRINRPYLVAGRVEEEFGAVTLTVDRIHNLSANSKTQPPTIAC